jgi:uncharacterized protein (DUF111 family)
VARLILGESSDAGGLIEMATNIDDMNPQLYAPVMDKLFAAGALDCWIVPVQMKKNRPGVVLHVLARSADEQKLAGILLAETTTLGIRSHTVTRQEAGREFRKVTTSWGEVTIKLKLIGTQIVGLSPEFDDCRRLAEEKGVAVRVVMEQAMAEAQKTIVPAKG